MLIAQISDFHIRPPEEPKVYGVDTNAMTDAAIAAITALDPLPDCVLVTGDLADCGREQEYMLAEAMLARLEMPVYVIPGNHDLREVMRGKLGARYPYLAEAGRFLSYVVDDFPVRLIGLDTVIEGEGGGEICADREAWFAERLAEGDGRPTLVFMHHAPFATGVYGMDEIMCRVSDNFGAIVRAHPEIERIVCGHYHRPIARRWNGTVGYVVPGVAHQVALDLRPGRSNRLVREPAALALHAWSPETGMISHTAAIGDFGDVVEFSLDPSYPGAGGRQ